MDNRQTPFNQCYSQSKYKAPTNAQKKSDGTYSYATDKTAEELYPKITDAAGTNFFDSKAHWMSMLIKGASPFTIKTSPKVIYEDIPFHFQNFPKGNMRTRGLSLLGHLKML